MARLAQAHRDRVWRKLRQLLIGANDPEHMFFRLPAETLQHLLAVVVRALALEKLPLEAVESPRAPWHRMLMLLAE